MTPENRDRFVIAPHHPDRLRRPGTSHATPTVERRQQALIWNVFRTLELITPSFWLRRMHVRLIGEPTAVPAQIVRVQLWPRLPLPPIQRIDGGRSDVLVDVLIETEHAVWTLVAPSHHNDLTDGEQAASIVDAVAWFAGARPSYFGVLDSDVASRSLGSLLRDRYARSRESARLRSAMRGPAAPAHVLWGAIGWPSLAALLQDCQYASSLPPIERALATNALDWLSLSGVTPATEHAPRQVISG